MYHDLQQFKKLYFQEFGVELTDEKAEAKARVFMTLVKAVYGSPDLTLKEYEQNQSRGDD